MSKVKLRQRITRCTRFAPLTKMLGFALHFAYTENVILPLIVVASFPAKVMVKSLSPGYVLWAFTISGVLFTLNSYLWKLALRRYESASS